MPASNVLRSLDTAYLRATAIGETPPQVAFFLLCYRYVGQPRAQDVATAGTVRQSLGCTCQRGVRGVTTLSAQKNNSKRKQADRKRKANAKKAASRYTESANVTLTPPMKVQVEAQLAKLEQAANPWWSTFCGVTNGIWLGQTAAFDPTSGIAVLAAGLVI